MKELKIMIEIVDLCLILFIEYLVFLSVCGGGAVVSLWPVTMTSVVCATIPTVFAGSSNYRVTTGWECVDNQHRDIRHSQPPPHHPEQYRYQGCGLSHFFPHSLQKLIHFREK